VKLALDRILRQADDGPREAQRGRTCVIIRAVFSCLFLFPVVLD